MRSNQKNRPRPGARECSPAQRKAIEGYVARALAPCTSVIHERESHIVHIDVHVVPPAADRPFWFLFTTGMSALPMRVPSGMGLVPHAELSLMLPPWWSMDTETWQREPRWFWPIRELADLARYPHRRETWLGEGHTVASAHPPRPFHASTKLAATLVLPSTLDMDESSAIEGDVPTQLLSLWPLHANELDFKLAYGSAALRERLSAAGVTAILEPRRASCVSSGVPARFNPVRLRQVP